eukprot:NODE_386_length_1812_cov_53.230856_g324_i0.p1 GENE.NODE_386_length_1812_cov_53.230856_g324_i0~~NODE_386_length_1812_cov_53.230856_g324_i0.p1  ORF type:complete len:561 (-),score=161.20 NODE_386_length_1812_cov_53.230856_g324_i0:128-1711(-)
MRYCSSNPLVWPFMFVVLFMLLYMLGETADSHFVPTLERISQSLRLSPNVAGVTFGNRENDCLFCFCLLRPPPPIAVLAFGNGAPDLSAILVSISQGTAANLGVGEPMGSGCFVTTAVMSAVALCSYTPVTRRPFIRDVLWYISSIAMIWIIMADGKIYWYEAVMILSWYAIYSLVVIFGRVLQQTIFKNKEPLATTSLLTTAQNDYHTLSSRSWLHSTSLSFSGHHYSNQHLSLHDVEETEKEGWLTRQLRTMWGDAGWEEKTALQKVLFVCVAPVTVVQNCTIPPPCNNSESWRKVWAVISVALSPMTALLFLKQYDWQLYTLAFASGLILATIVALTSDVDRPPPYDIVFTFLSFCMCIMWMYALASEVVNILQSFGIMFKVSQTTLAVTVLTWGNSIGDFVADFGVAKAGLTSMATGAIYGGQMFNLLTGLGLAFLSESLKTYPYYEKRLCSDQVFSMMTLLISLSMALVVVPLVGRFSIPRLFAVPLVVLYIWYIVMFILFEMQVTEFNFLPFPSSYVDCRV